MIPTAILCSGEGTNLQALIDAAKNRNINAEIRCVISDQPKARGLERAREAGLEALAIDDPERAAREEKTLEALQQRNIGLVCLAGYMRVLSETLVCPYLGRMLNIHPSLLPRHRGLRPHRQALEAGDAEHGCSVHFVTRKPDAGPIIIQARVPVMPDDTEDSLAARVLDQEHQIYPRAVRWFCEGALRLEGETVWLHEQPLTQPVRHEDLV